MGAEEPIEESGWHHDSVKLEHSGPEGGPIGVNVPAPGTHRIDVEALSPQHRAALLAAKALPPKSEELWSKRQLAWIAQKAP